MLKSKKILIAITGSIAAYKIMGVISSLVKEGAEVRTILTSSAPNFIGAATLEGLTGAPPITDDFSHSQNMAHIDLGKWCDLFAIMPATAQSINSLANGVGHGPLISTFLAYDLQKPILLAPAMNQRMWTHPTTQQSVFKLKQMGINILGPQSGALACKEIGPGRLIEPTEIFSIIKTMISTEVKTLKNKILVTYGGTSEDIDGVRKITNFSTGNTGKTIAETLSSDYSVDVIRAESSPTSSNCDNSTFTDYNSLAKNLKTKLQNNSYNIVIQCAAISDFKVSHILVDGKNYSKSSGKISSSQKMEIHLTKTEKLIANIKFWSLTPTILIGFKLTKGQAKSCEATSINKVFSSGADFVVHNRLEEVQGSQHLFNLYNKSGIVTSGTNKIELAHAIKNITKTGNIPNYCPEVSV